MKRKTFIKTTLGSIPALALPNALLESKLFKGQKNKKFREDQVYRFSSKTKSYSAPKYNVTHKKIVGNNIANYNNRPLYINNTNAFILTGDKPIARLVKEQYLYGTFMIAVKREGKTKWLHRCDCIHSYYSPGRMEWEVTDENFSELKIKLEILPMASTTGMAIRAHAEGIQPGDKLIWSFSGAKWFKNKDLSTEFDVMGHPEILDWEYFPQASENNRIELKNQFYFLSLLDQTKNNEIFTVAGNCDESTTINIGNASEWEDPIALKNSKAKSLPFLTGIVPLSKGKTISWAFEAFNQNNKIDLSEISDPERAFIDGLKRTKSFQNRLEISTPDRYLNAIAQASVAAVDGTWYPPVFRHGAMQWNARLPGWRTIYGGTMYGWHDRVRDEAKFYIDAQIKESNKTEPKADPDKLLTLQSSKSRFYGVGRINKDQGRYNMQSQFFNQIIEEYRWTNSPELIETLQESLELHLLWLRDCFDPDDDGVYESYLNTWPTDSQWYNGGGTAEETAYAYRGHLAARDMAKNVGNKEAVEFHNQMVEKIEKGFFNELWIKQKGHAGAYREQGGNERLHENPWLYSIFLPVDAGLTTPIQAIESVYYSEWALQNDQMPSGGRKVWTSNWIPGIWSVRTLWPGDNYHLALSYFKAGLPNDGWDIMRGTFMHSGFNSRVPGNLGDIRGGTDFGDCVHTFARVLVMGLFGFNPDYPNGKVKISPNFPTDWEHAAIELPDVKISFNQQEYKTKYNVELSRTADLELFLPVQCEKVKKVTVNGQKISWKLLPTAGRTIVYIEKLKSKKAEVIIETGTVLPYYSPVTIKANATESVQIKAKNAKIISYEDPQEVFEHGKIEQGVIIAKLSKNQGYHTITVRVNAGKVPQLRIYRIKVNDPENKRQKKKRFVSEVPAGANWEVINLSPLFNADVRTIYKQEYLSPRPNTVSARLGVDGYSPWTFPIWDSEPPEIQLDNINNLLDSKNRLITPQSVPFKWDDRTKNIVFTSMWDNYPTKINHPINKGGTAIYFLICGSTNVMQCQIANAVVHLNYVNGQKDSLELVPPVNYWNLSPIESNATAPGQVGRSYYTSEIDEFCLPEKLPETVQLGKNCRAMVLNTKLKSDVNLKSVTFETLSQEVVVGLMGITIMD